MPFKDEKPPAKLKEKPSTNGEPLLTIPKAELCGAELAVKLMPVVSQALNIDRCYYWTDATAVLYQIHSPNQHRDVFVRNRVAKIRSVSTPSQWRHVISSENPADVLSRGCRVRTLLSNSLWWHAPDWLLQQGDRWPIAFDPSKPIRSVPEIVDCLAMSSDVTETALLVAPTPTLSSIYEWLIDHGSSWQRILRTLAWILRAVALFKLGGVRRTRSTAKTFPEFLQVKELQSAETLLLKWDQAHHLQDVIALVRVNRQNDLPQFMRTIRPFLDNEGLLRVEGRLDRAPEAFELRHPIIVPQGRLSHLLARQEHHR